MSAVRNGYGRNSLNTNWDIPSDAPVLNRWQLLMKFLMKQSMFFLQFSQNLDIWNCIRNALCLYVKFLCCKYVFYLLECSVGQSELMQDLWNTLYRDACALKTSSASDCGPLNGIAFSTQYHNQKDLIDLMTQWFQFLYGLKCLKQTNYGDLVM